ncbi:MAG: branched-chain amino acid transport system ATP-binding protein livF [Actinomycetota bacterium]|jgi:branched-chain amino acid transport system ATP-binding protein|nr:branched-chain amino acid transport system ATP-binding protein livF [Actinomycetota bacterium]
MADAPLLELKAVDAGYGAVQVLRKVDLSVRPGEIIALLGTNGAGKSTILKVVSGLLHPWGGQVLFDGEDISKLPPEQTVPLGISQVPGGRGLLPNLTVLENLQMGAHTIRKDRARVKNAIERIYELFPRLSERRTQLAGTLSGGEAQMLALGRTFVLEPRLIMIDELSLGLAPTIVQGLVDILHRMNGEGVAFVLVEQHANLALSITEHAYFLEKGQMRFDGASAELLQREDLLRSVFLAGAKVEA